jgi:hypothetical protein
MAMSRLKSDGQRQSGPKSWLFPSAEIAGIVALLTIPHLGEAASPFQSFSALAAIRI